MTLEEFLGITGLVFVAIGYIGYRWCSKNTYLKYKEQRVGGKKR
jgi:hypothetical protein